MQKCLISNSSLKAPPSWFNFSAPVISQIESTRKILNYRNLFHLYRRNCDATKKTIISIYPQNIDLKVYDKAYWFSDAWDPFEYGQNYNPSISIFEQFNQLVRKVPQFSLQNVNSENSDYCNSIESAKDCYLAFVAYGNCKDVYYSYRTIASSDIYFSITTTNSELLFFCAFSSNCYDCVFCEHCRNSQSCLLSFSLENCQNCIFCNNLQNKQNYIFNKPATAEQVKEFKSKLNLGSYNNFLQCFNKFQLLKNNALWKTSYNLNCEDVSGNELINCNKVYDSFVGNESQDIHESYHFSGPSQQCYRSFGFAKSNNLYMVSGSSNTSESQFMIFGYNCYNCEYSINLHNCKNCFFCSGLRNKEFCILNKQYTQEQYYQLKEIIIAKMKERIIDDPILSKHDVREYGQWFPTKFAFFPYNKSYAQANFPLTKEEILARNLKWEDETSEFSGSQELYNTPDLINNWSDNLDGKVLQCEDTAKYYNLIPQVVRKFKENNLSFFKKHPLNYLISKQQTSRLWMEERTTVDGKKSSSVFTNESAPKVCLPDDYNQMI